MRTDKIRKYLILNIPYLFILWAFLKLGTAYRLAAGNDFAHKLIGLGQTIGPAFADFAPGLVTLDWLVGIVGAVGFRLLIYFKSKNAKKFRRDAEYGSARRGTEKDIKPFVDPKFENNVILTGTEFLTMNTRPKIPANARFFGIFSLPPAGHQGRFRLISSCKAFCATMQKRKKEVSHMDEAIAQRCIAEAHYMLRHRTTIRQTAAAFQLSKSGIHKDMLQHLPQADAALAREVSALLAYNKSVRHLRGGEATRRRYAQEKSRKSAECLQFPENTLY